MAEVIKNRYDFVILFDVENGNPNGDPDAGNMPRIDQETGQGLVTDVCLKRKIRNYVEAVYDGKPGYRIYIKQNVPLERTNQEAFNYFGVKNSDIKNLKSNNPEIDLKIRDFICENFFDIRTPSSTNEENLKKDLSDILQLCTQAICLEEMLCCDIPEGYLFYDEIIAVKK